MISLYQDTAMQSKSTKEIILKRKVRFTPPEGLVTTTEELVL
jgi:hypothetical protein